MSKYVRFSGPDVIIGKTFPDYSRCDMLRIFTDEHNVFNIKFMMSSDLAYTFLPECTELLEILKKGIVGVSVQDIGLALIEAGYERRK